MGTNSISLIISTTLTGLMAGLFFAWSVSVTPGLKNLSNAEFVASFQSMNRAILNPVFLSAFVGAAIASIVTCFFYFKGWGDLSFLLLLGAALLYVIGVFGVTMLFNVPLNNLLDAVDLKTANPQQLEEFRRSFEKPWNSYNTVRTICSFLSLLLSVVACIIKR